MEKVDTEQSRSCAVLVTGASGFLGQHVVGLLQTHATHVTDIRVLDVVPYVNRLDNQESKPVKEFIGSLNDFDLVMRACKGVNCVMHIASVVDVRMFPDRQLLEKVNVKGTEALLNACKQQRVQRFIYCSSVDVIVGNHDIVDGSEDSTFTPSSFAMQDYAETKHKAELMVLQANGPTMTTVSLRPTGMYGEQDRHSISKALEIASQTGFYVDFGPDHVRHEHAYVGNVAWMFICADKTMFESTAKCTNHTVGANTFFAIDDTPLLNFIDLVKPIYEACGLQRVPIKFPFWLVLNSVYIVYFLLVILRLFVDFNFTIGPAVLRTHKLSISLRYDKARKMLGYTPLYSFQESMRRSLKFYMSLGYGNRQINKPKSV